MKISLKFVMKKKFIFIKVLLYKGSTVGIVNFYDIPKDISLVM